jgi:spore coat protein SA
VYKSFSQPFAPDAFIFVSEAMRQEALNLFPGIKGTYAVHNGADEAVFYPRQPQSAPVNAVPIILYVGRLIPKKGIGVLMDAMRILQERHVEAACKVFGWPDVHGARLPAYVNWLVKTSPPNVTFEGFRSAKDIGDEYRRSDIFCCPSTWQEPCGLVNIEAMACRIAVVATHVGGIPEIASGGGVLLVVPESPVDLANALQKVVLDKALRSRLADEGLSSYRRSFTWSLVNTQYQKINKGLGQGL